MDMLALILSIIGSIWSPGSSAARRPSSAASSTRSSASQDCGASRCCSAAARCAPQRTMHNHQKNCTKADCRTEPQWPAGSLFFSFYQSSAAATVGTTRMPAAMSIV